MRKLISLLSLVLLSCSRSPSIPIEAELHVRSNDPSSKCKLSGTFHVPRAASQSISGGTDWKGTATIGEGDLVVLNATINGEEIWACEMDCAIRQVGSRTSTTSKNNARESRPAPTCPASRTANVTCVLQASSR
jgi:hypothetical protein